MSKIAFAEAFVMEIKIYCIHCIIRLKYSVEGIKGF